MLNKFYLNSFENFYVICTGLIIYKQMLEGLTLSIVGSIGGIALSLSLGWLLIYKINVQSFGWTLTPSVPTLSIFSLFVLMLTISSAVSWLVGKKNAILDFELTSK